MSENASNIILLINKNEEQEEKFKALNNFCETQAQTFSFPELNDNQRTEVWNSLYDITSKSTDLSVLKNCFIALRILSREKFSLNKLFNDDWLQIVLKHSGLNDVKFVYSDGNLEVAIEALKCLCNLIFNSEVVAENCFKHGLLEKLFEQEREHTKTRIPSEIIYFNCKIIFLITAVCSETRKTVKNVIKGELIMVELLQVVLDDLKSSSTLTLNDEIVDYVCEILKALFNVTTIQVNKISDDELTCYALLMSTLRVFILLPVSNKEKKNILMTNIVHLLTNIPGECYNNLITPIEPPMILPENLKFESNNMSVFYELLCYLQSIFIIGIKVSKQNETLSPIILVLLKGSMSVRAIRKYLRSQILPPLTDVHRRPEVGTNLRNHLCRLLTSPMTGLRDMVANLLFILCKKNINRMTKYTGYGNAVGLFAKLGLLGRQADESALEFSDDEENSDTEEYIKYKHGINPVTGCFEKPHADPMANMTEEEKEYEALKLVQLMHELTQCGMIKPCRVGANGKPEPIEHILQLQEGLRTQQINNQDSDSD